MRRFLGAEETTDPHALRAQSVYIPTAAYGGICHPYDQKGCDIVLWQQRIPL